MKEIPLTKGFVALVDDEDFERLSVHRWHMVTAYAGRKVRNGDRVGATMMHRELMSPPPGMVVDHINGDTLDNRKNNLRVCTPSQNKTNRICIGKSGFKGVESRRNGSVWVVRMNRESKQLYFGRFRSAEEAARAYDEHARKIHGEFARLNFPREGEQSAKGVSYRNRMRRSAALEDAERRKVERV